MTYQSLEEILELLGMDVASKPVDILRALLNAQSELGVFLEFSDIRTELESLVDGKSLDRSLVHRQLKSLIEEGYVRVDNSGYRHRYMTNISTLANVLEKKISEYRIFLKEEIDRIDKDLYLLDQTDASDLGKSLIELMSGMKSEERPHFASGLDGLLRLVKGEVQSKARRGETIKATADWLNTEADLKPEQVAWISDLATRGVKMKVLGQFRSAKEAQKRVRKLYDIMQILGLDIEYRIRPLKKATYQFVGFKRIGIVLVVSENPLASTWIPKQSNPLLINHAIETFDRDFEAAEPIIFDDYHV
ncbi:MAG: hypothetical protein EAX81_00500 [Candidatus Thorarchaeota archaeon]|nr:hypothetical protein [Candidatus Thorarchaeota archaeon]